MLSVKTNLSSLITQTNLKNSTSGLNAAIERMSTGFKINHAKDNAASYSISTNMSTKIGAYQVAEDNVAMGLDMLSTAQGTLSEIEDKFSRLRALEEQAKNGTYGEQSLNAINAEARALVSEINRLYGSAEYNKMKLFETEEETLKAGDSGFINPITRRDTTYMTTLASVDETQALASGTYSISTAEELAKLATMTNNGLVGENTEFVLANDISLKNYQTGEGWTPIGNRTNSFNATLDGNGYVISDLYINRPNSSEQGLFGRASQGYIRNVGIENSIVLGMNSCGALVGIGSITIINCYATAKVSGRQDVGGIIGNSGSKIEYSYATGNIKGGEANWCAGGLVGYLAHSGKVSNSYSAGTVTGNKSCGGLVGGMLGSITNCYTTCKVEGADSFIGAITGQLTASASITNCSYYSSINPGLDAVYLEGGVINPGDVIDKVSLPTKEIDLQVGINSNASSQISLELGFDLGGIYELNRIGKSKADFFSKIDNYLSLVSAKQTELGAAQNRLESALEEIGIQYENLVSSRSTIRDADIAEESSSYIKMQILQQASATLLATANQTPSIALQLI